MTISKAQSLESYIQSCAKLVEQQLDLVFPKEWDIPAQLVESMHYSLSAGGKRMRPILTIAAAESFGVDASKVLAIACAIELVHTYSLIHDDLPAMDNDDFRRGKPTNHRVYGEAMAILAGDGLLTHAFYLASDGAIAAGVPADKAIQIVRELAEYAGPRGMVGGQAADILGEQGLTALSELEYIHLHKTSDLIVYSLRAGAIAANANEQQLLALTKYGTCIGLAFQIQDDVLDLIGDEAKLGKSTQSDVKEQKVTFPYLLGVDACMAKVESLTNEGKEALLECGIPYPERLLQLADHLMKRDH